MQSTVRDILSTNLYGYNANSLKAQNVGNLNDWAIAACLQYWLDHTPILLTPDRFDVLMRLNGNPPKHKIAPKNSYGRKRLSTS